MRTLTAFTSVTLDGVMQAPGSPEEDTRGGFAHGGWAGPYADETTMAPAGGEMGDLLFGRRTFASMEAGWANGPADNPFTAIMNAARKYVASRTLEQPPSWANSVLLRGDAAPAVAELKEQDGPRLVVLGSGELTRSLMHAGLIDSFVLLIHPLVLGTGLRLFENGSPHTQLELVSSTASSTGVIVATYRPR
jgi:dihydrofolate reductase